MEDNNNNLWHLLLIIAFYHQTKILISFVVGGDQTSNFYSMTINFTSWVNSNPQVISTP